MHYKIKVIKLLYMSDTNRSTKWVCTYPFPYPLKKFEYYLFSIKVSIFPQNQNESETLSTYTNLFVMST